MLAYSVNNSMPTPPAEVYLGQRNIWFTTKPEDLGVSFLLESGIPYATVMDIGLDAGTVTIISSNLGDGSVYTSTCGEIPGGGKRENARKASTNFVMIEGGFIDKMKLTTEFQLSLKKQISNLFTNSNRRIHNKRS